MAPGAVRFCERHLRADMVALEWGSGRSTPWFARRVGSLVGVEHDPTWHERVARRLREAGLGNVDLRLVSIDPDPERAQSDYWRNPPYVRVADEFADESLDFVSVDGVYRQACVAVILPKLKPGGLLLVDDTRWLPRLEDWLVPPDWPVVHDGRGFGSGTTIWRKP